MEASKIYSMKDFIYMEPNTVLNKEVAKNMSEEEIIKTMEDFNKKQKPSRVQIDKVVGGFLVDIHGKYMMSGNDESRTIHLTLDEALARIKKELGE